MAWVDLSTAFQYGTKLTSSNQQQLRDNIAAAFAKDSGAPVLADNYIVTAMIADLQVTEAKLAASVYGRAKVKSSTGGSSSTLASLTSVNITAQDYCFCPVFGGNNNQDLTVRCSSAYSGTAASWSVRNLHTESTYTYDFDWRYITATDEPFIFVLRNKKTGKFEHLWFCGDPPPEYWGAKEKPDDFKPPIGVENPEDYDEITKFLFSQTFLDEMVARKKADKKFTIDIINNFEYDDQTKLFKTKNLSTI